jgi:CBS domain-containing protein
MILNVETAADLMHPNPVSIRDNASIREAIALLSDKGFSAAPVIDNAGRPIGVVSRSDILTHDRERVEYKKHKVPDYYDEGDLTDLPEEFYRPGFEVVDVDPTRVSDIMTPVVFSVHPDTPTRKAVAEMLALKVHRLFVVDRDGVLIGVISATDVLRCLQ